MASGYDPVISLMISLKNATLAGRSSLTAPHSGYREAVLKKLKELELLDYHIFRPKDGAGRFFEISIAGPDEARQKLRGLKLYSRPGRRLYAKTSRLKNLWQRGVRRLMLSTPQGVMEINEALKRNLGGALLFEI